MRLVTYARGDERRCGVMIGDRVLDTTSVAEATGLEESPAFRSTRAVIQAGQGAWERLASEAADAAGRGDGFPLSEVNLWAPVEDPDKIICLGLNYRDHAREAGLALPAAPMFFAKFKNSLTGPESPIVLPASSAAVDFEAEVAVVMGRTAKHVAAAEAISYVAGVMAFNDVSARDLQHATSQWGAGKAIDTFAPCGPALVLLDEIDDLQAIGLRARVNGEILQDGSTADMIFSVAETIEFLTSVMTLEPGDIIATGTPAGVGFSRDPKVLLRPGDVVEIEVDGIGTLRNPVVAAHHESVGERRVAAAV